ncbi:11022_t:CDS:2 [Funneliformis geosporum]|uniref:12186_t:CDS:1 n=1 Tax=Funneliformis geosporum TaxID=1117311 RepID=A0A9W4T572_9GLOM|nr:12186_t:CDS:2 [Funneliformis geosporum]CAI2194092.1 11022_t:CDS:2 [Funneliformis geosporum]
MNRNFIFVFILLATLSLTNAFPRQLQKRTTSFTQCSPPEGSTTSPPLLSVILNPDPVVNGKPDNYTVSGTLDADITETTQLVVAYGDPVAKQIVGDPYTGPVCQDAGCPIKAKSPFSISADIPTPDLPSPYMIVVGIVEPPQTILGCAIATVGDLPPNGASPPYSLKSFYNNFPKSDDTIEKDENTSSSEYEGLIRQSLNNSIEKYIKLSREEILLEIKNRKNGKNIQEDRRDIMSLFLLKYSNIKNKDDVDRNIEQRQHSEENVDVTDDVI